MSHHIRGKGRSQITLFPEVLDDFVSEENPVRVIDVFVDELDLAKLGFQSVIPKNTGRPGYHPAVLLKLYIYGYLNRIQSSRRLEREANRNVELMWLTERLAPDFKTIADFRRDNGKGIKNACRHFISICRQLNMFNEAVVAIDGSKFKAVNNKRNNFTPKKLKTFIGRVEAHISRYLDALNEADKDESNKDTTSIEEKIQWLKTRLAELHLLEKEVEAHPDKQISTTDPDSRLMITNGFERKVCYNVQSAVDSKHHLIIAHEVTNTYDRSQLCRMGQQAQDALGKTDITVIADKGYFAGQDIKDTQDAGMIALVPKGDTSGSEKKGIFNRALFKYDAETDAYICPENKVLSFRNLSVEKGLGVKIYYSDVMTCRACSMKSNCTSSPQSRRIRRWEHEERLEEMEKLLEANPDSMLIRRQTVEHPFGTIKSWMGASHFLTRRFKGVSIEMDLHVLAYNLKRMTSIFGTKDLLSALTA